MARNGGRRWWCRIAVAAAFLAAWPGAVAAQDRIDRLDPANAIQQSRLPEPDRAPRAIDPGIAAAERHEITTSIPPFVAGAVQIDGATALSPAMFAPTIEPYLGRTLSTTDLRALARDVGEAARRAGYGFATAWVPQQTVNSGVLRVRLDEGRIEAIEASGPAAAEVERLLRRLANGVPLTTASLERQLMLAEDVAGVSLSHIRLDRRGGRNVLLLDTGLERVRARATIDNWSTASVGPYESRVVVDVNGAFRFGDQLTVGAMVTPLQPRELQLFEAGYAIPLGAAGTLATVRGYISHMAAGGELRDRDFAGTSIEIEAGFSHPIVRSRAENLWAHLFLTVRDSELSENDVLIRDDRIVALSATLYGTRRMLGGYGRARLSLAQGLDVLGATRRGDPVASRDDGGGAFTKLTAWAEFTHGLGKGFSLQLSGLGQLATRPLLATEEMGLGGRSFLRGYDYREFVGDGGIAGSAELRYNLRDPPLGLQRLQLYLYSDAGRVRNLRGGFGGGALASAGGGLRFSLDRRVETGVELGIPLSDGFDGGRPDPRVSFTLSTAI